jgi:hypothetical protein
MNTRPFWKIPHSGDRPVGGSIGRRWSLAMELGFEWIISDISPSVSNE